MTKDYSPSGYDEDKPLLEKLLFSAPEYFFYETRPGRWFVLQLQNLLDYLNDILISSAPSRVVKGFTGKIVVTLSDLVTRILGWINSLLEKEQTE
jgi:hypothetical protein